MTGLHACTGDPSLLLFRPTYFNNNQSAKDLLADKDKRVLIEKLTATAKED